MAIYSTDTIEKIIKLIDDVAVNEALIRIRKTLVDALARDDIVNLLVDHVSEGDTLYGITVPEGLDTCVTSVGTSGNDIHMFYGRASANDIATIVRGKSLSETVYSKRDIWPYALRTLEEKLEAAQNTIMALNGLDGSEFEYVIDSYLLGGPDDGIDNSDSIDQFTIRVKEDSILYTDLEFTVYLTERSELDAYSITSLRGDAYLGPFRAVGIDIPQNTIPNVPLIEGDPDHY